MRARWEALAAERASADAARTEHSIANIQRDFVEWHRGRPHYLLWALELDREPVRTRLAAAQQHLRALLLPGYERQAHITLSLCGFPARQPAAADEFGRTLLERQLQALDALPTRSFSLQIGALDSFSSAPFLTIEAEDGWTERLHRCLELSPVPGADTPFRAHLTVGLYAGCWPLDAVRRQLERFDPGPALQLPVDKLHLLAYDSAAIGGPLYPVLSYALERKQWQLDAAAAAVLPFTLSPAATASQRS